AGQPDRHRRPERPPAVRLAALPGRAGSWGSSRPAGRDRPPGRPGSLRLARDRDRRPRLRGDRRGLHGRPGCRGPRTHGDPRQDREGSRRVLHGGPDRMARPRADGRGARGGPGRAQLVWGRGARGSGARGSRSMTAATLAMRDVWAETLIELGSVNPDLLVLDG